MSVTVDLKGLSEGIVALDAIAGGTKGATAKAINGAIPKIRKKITDKVAGDYFVNKSTVTKTLSTQRANASNLSAFIKSKGRPIALSKFKVSPKRPPARRGRTVTSQVKRNSGGGAIPNAFVARMKTGHVGVMFRKSADRYPIGQFHGPAIPSMLGNTLVSAFIGDTAKEELLKQLGVSFDALIGGAK